jgi:putative endonuclease
LSDWYVYIIETKCAKLYTGITTDLTRRYEEHSSMREGGTKGAKFFRAHEVNRMVWSERHTSRSMASKREAEIKTMPRAKKLALLATSPYPLHQMPERSS